MIKGKKKRTGIMIRTWIFPLIIMVLSGSVCLAGTRYAGKTSGVFLEYPVGAQPAGMGNAYTAMANDINGIWWNPAGLSLLDKKELLFMHTGYVEDVNQEYGAFALPLSRFGGGVGISVNYLDFGNFKRATVTSGNAGLTTGIYDVNSYAVTLAYGRPIYNIDVGVGLKYIKEHLDAYSGSAAGVDIGVKYRYYDRLVFGYTLQNLGTGIKFQSEKNILPLTSRVGVGYRSPDERLSIAADAVKCVLSANMRKT